MKTEEAPIRVHIPLDKGSQPPAIIVPLLEDISAGAIIRVATPVMAIQNLVADNLALADGTVCEPLLRYEVAKQRADWVDHPQQAGILTVTAPRDLSKGDVLTFTSHFGEIDYAAGDTYERYTNEPSRPYFSGMSWVFFLETTESIEVGAERHTVSPEFHMVFETGAPDQLEAFWKADGSLNIRHYDYSSNPAYKSGSSTITAPSGEETELVREEDIVKNGIQTDDTLPVGSRYKITDSDGKTVLSNAKPSTADGKLVCFGEIHWHSEISSDGKRPLRDAMRTARDELCMDFAGPADHIGGEGVFMFGTPEEQCEILMEYDTPGTFAIMPGAELSHRVGHANYYCDTVENYIQVCKNLEGAIESNPWNEVAEYGWKALTGAIIPGHTFLVPHHTNTNSFDREGVVNKENGRPFWSAMTFPQGVEMAHLRLFEIYQGRGNFEDETLDDEWRIAAGGYGASARSALMKGYRFGFTGGTDNHQGWPCRNHAGGMIDGYTAVISESIDTKSIWKALHARRCYATTGARIICDVTMNGQPIGSELKLEWNAERKMKINIYGTAPIQKVEVISAGITIDSIPVDGESWDLETEWEDTRPGRPLDDVYYYLRIRQTDGNIAWLSPFWVDASD